ncbi:MAG TPA: sialidase family protein [Bryobacteraceae bacterium]|jgi:predicted neuraminidase|nr:sialidase family protein [Bryobacteraceae bacterium]
MAISCSTAKKRRRRTTDRSRVLLLALVFSLSSHLDAATSRQFIFETAPFASAHASSIVELKNGDLLAAWFGGSAEGKPDVAIWSARYHDGRWSEPRVLVREHEIACYNPVLFYTRDGRLWLYYKFGPSPREWTAGRAWSDDDGQTWSATEHLPAGLYGPIRTKPLVLADGTVVSGTSVESYHSWACWIERSTDNGRSWHRIGPITVPHRDGIIQPSVIELAPNHLRLYARSTRNIGHICMADSFDAGLTWSSARPLDVPNPNSGIDVVKLKDGRIVLAYNDSPDQRTPLNLALSRDGEHFQKFATLESGPGEFSYPSLIESRSGDLLLTYTWKRRRIAFARIPSEEIPR